MAGEATSFQGLLDPKRQPPEDKPFYSLEGDEGSVLIPGTELVKKNGYIRAVQPSTAPHVEDFDVRPDDGSIGVVLHIGDGGLNLVCINGVEVQPANRSFPGQTPEEVYVLPPGVHERSVKDVLVACKTDFTGFQAATATACVETAVYAPFVNKRLALSRLPEMQQRDILAGNDSDRHCDFARTNVTTKCLAFPYPLAAAGSASISIVDATGTDSALAKQGSQNAATALLSAVMRMPADDLQDILVQNLVAAFSMTVLPTVVRRVGGLEKILEGNEGTNAISTGAGNSARAFGTRKFDSARKTLQRTAPLIPVRITPPKKVTFRDGNNASVIQTMTERLTRLKIKIQTMSLDQIKSEFLANDSAEETKELKFLFNFLFDGAMHEQTRAMLRNANLPEDQMKRVTKELEKNEYYADRPVLLAAFWTHIHDRAKQAYAMQRIRIDIDVGGGQEQGTTKTIYLEARVNDALCAHATASGLEDELLKFDECVKELLSVGFDKLEQQPKPSGNLMRSGPDPFVMMASSLMSLQSALHAMKPESSQTCAKRSSGVYKEVGGDVDYDVTPRPYAGDDSDVLRDQLEKDMPGNEFITSRVDALFRQEIARARHCPAPSLSAYKLIPINLIETHMEILDEWRRVELPSASSSILDKVNPVASSAEDPYEKLVLYHTERLENNFFEYFDLVSDSLLKPKANELRHVAQQMLSRHGRFLQEVMSIARADQTSNPTDFTKQLFDRVWNTLHYATNDANVARLVAATALAGKSKLDEITDTEFERLKTKPLADWGIGAQMVALSNAKSNTVCCFALNNDGSVQSVSSYGPAPSRSQEKTWLLAIQNGNLFEYKLRSLKTATLPQLVFPQKTKKATPLKKDNYTQDLQGVVDNALRAYKDPTEPPPPRADIATRYRHEVYLDLAFIAFVATLWQVLNLVPKWNETASMDIDDLPGAMGMREGFDVQVQLTQDIVKKLPSTMREDVAVALAGIQTLILEYSAYATSAISRAKTRVQTALSEEAVSSLHKSALAAAVSNPSTFGNTVGRLWDAFLGNRQTITSTLRDQVSQWKTNLYLALSPQTSNLGLVTQAVLSAGLVMTFYNYAIPAPVATPIMEYAQSVLQLGNVVQKIVQLAGVRDGNAQLSWYDTGQLVAYFVDLIPKAVNFAFSLGGVLTTATAEYTEDMASLALYKLLRPAASYALNRNRLTDYRRFSILALLQKIENIDSKDNRSCVTQLNRVYDEQFGRDWSNRLPVQLYEVYAISEEKKLSKRVAVINTNSLVDGRVLALRMPVEMYSYLSQLYGQWKRVQTQPPLLMKHLFAAGVDKQKLARDALNFIHNLDLTSQVSPRSVDMMNNFVLDGVVQYMKARGTSPALDDLVFQAFTGSSSAMLATVYANELLLDKTGNAFADYVRALETEAQKFQPTNRGDVQLTDKRNSTSEDDPSLADLGPRMLNNFTRDDDGLYDWLITHVFRRGSTYGIGALAGEFRRNQSLSWQYSTNALESWELEDGLVRNPTNTTFLKTFVIPFGYMPSSDAATDDNGRFKLSYMSPTFEEKLWFDRLPPQEDNTSVDAVTVILRTVDKVKVPHANQDRLSYNLDSKLAKHPYCIFYDDFAEGAAIATVCTPPSAASSSVFDQTVARQEKMQTRLYNAHRIASAALIAAKELLSPFRVVVRVPEGMSQDLKDMAVSACIAHALLSQQGKTCTSVRLEEVDDDVDSVYENYNTIAKKGDSITVGSDNTTRAYNVGMHAAFLALFL
jgi:hypothetical protein